MATTKQRFIVNTRGKRVSVVLDMGEYRRMLAELEELESIRAYDRAKALGETPIPLEDAIEEIERGRR